MRMRGPIQSLHSNLKMRAKTSLRGCRAIHSHCRRVCSVAVDSESLGGEDEAERQLMTTASSDREGFAPALDGREP